MIDPLLPGGADSWNAFDPNRHFQGERSRTTVTLGGYEHGDYPQNADESALSYGISAKIGTHLRTRRETDDNEDTFLYL